MTGEVVTSSGSVKVPGGAVLALLGSAVSNQVGAALGDLAFARVGPPGVVAVRQLIAAISLTALARPNLARMSWGQWWPALSLGGVFAVMNLSLYTAVGRIGLGLAITLEFLGPVTVALVGARSWRVAGCAVGAGAGVVLLVSPGPSTDWIGVALACTAALCWAAYIVLNRVVGSRLPGLQGPAVASCASALASLPILLSLLLTGRFDVSTSVLCTAVGVLSSVVPYATDVVVLRRIPQSLFGIVMSLNPVAAAAVGLIVLGQQLAPWQWGGIVFIVASDAVAVAGSGPRSRPRSR
ncbi:DMT family transporter [Curtobacterium sp. MCBD17_019]|uniref:EamA family transporter n=1 Tax=Curtobacterium sp. MCBD17_019 TaxID=2175669 RepID=UPI000DA7CB43|nr:EamA family transporter [Curtobacterium sp. MCBD17_019]PZE73924.1 EamA family transporter [Curtobacterium sp. MCBD17_019]